MNSTGHPEAVGTTACSSLSFFITLVWLRHDPTYTFLASICLIHERSLAHILNRRMRTLFERFEDGLTQWPSGSVFQQKLSIIQMACVRDRANISRVSFYELWTPLGASRTIFRVGQKSEIAGTKSAHEYPLPPGIHALFLSLH